MRGVKPHNPSLMKEAKKLLSTLIKNEPRHKLEHAAEEKVAGLVVKSYAFLLSLKENRNQNMLE